MRVIAYGAALVFGTGVGVLRIAAGAHFFSDVVFAGVFMYLLIWLAHGLIYRWAATRISEDWIDDLLARAGESIGDSWSALWRRLAAAVAKGHFKKIGVISPAAPAR